MPPRAGARVNGSQQPRQRALVFAYTARPSGAEIVDHETGLLAHGRMAPIGADNEIGAHRKRTRGCFGPGLLVTTEAMVAEKPEKKTPPAMAHGGGMDEF